jgi:hypothetical protein
MKETLEEIILHSTGEKYQCIIPPIPENITLFGDEEFPYEEAEEESESNSDDPNKVGTQNESESNTLAKIKEATLHIVAGLSACLLRVSSSFFIFFVQSNICEHMNI